MRLFYVTKVNSLNKVLNEAGKNLIYCLTLVTNLTINNLTLLPVIKCICFISKRILERKFQISLVRI